MVFETGKAQFVNESRRADLLKEQGYQSEHATPESQVAVGRQLGAHYMLSGSLAEMPGARIPAGAQLLQAHG